MQNSGDSSVLRNVGANLRALRKECGLSQQALADKSGVSRRTIINLEAGEANVSLSGLDHLAEALGARFIDLVSAPAAKPGQINELAWRGQSPLSRAVLLGSAAASEEVQLWTWTLGAGERYDAEPDPVGWSEMLLVINGVLRVEFADTTVELSPGEHLSYPSSQNYAYVAVGDQPVHFVRNVVS